MDGTDMSNGALPVQQLSLSRPSTPAGPASPVSEIPLDDSLPEAILILKDGTSFRGLSFGAVIKSVSGECVCQTGMVGYPESLTDPSYHGQILILTFPLIGNYGVPSRDERNDFLADIPKYFESSRIHVTGLVVGHYSRDYSHHLAKSSLAEWLKENNIPAIYGVDTRALTKKIRTQGVLLGKILFPKSVVGNTSNVMRVGMDATSRLRSEPWLHEYQDIDWVDPNKKNLVAEVSIRQPKVYSPDPTKAIKGVNGKTLRILAIDVGMKYSQLRCFVDRNVEIKVVPWNYDFLQEKDYDGLFISNGPGDPGMVQVTIERLRIALKEAKTPIFGICLGHQLLGLAAGAKTMKMKYGNRGHNIPCTDMISGRCYITSQNHGYAVDADTLPEEYQELFVNANDHSNEGFIHKTLPIFSVQFHPEANPGPRDTEYLFDVFINSVIDSNKARKLVYVRMPGGTKSDNDRKNPRVDVKKVLILGSGGLSIGQAGEFDYSGSQAIKALKEEGIYTILINPNIATIQTSDSLADKVYFLPVDPEFVRKVIKHEKPDGIYVTFGGQTALNVGVKLRNEFESLGVKVLGTPIDTIITTEDREAFAQLLLEIGEKCAKSAPATNVQEALQAAELIGYPIICRAAYALGGLGSGFAENEAQLTELCTKAFATSSQVLIERSMKGWKEIEYEVVRDCRDNCITVCNMENFDPLGIHTGDSIVVAPSQTLSDEDYQMLRSSAISVIRRLGVVGECNIQYALNPFSNEYCIIEVNARLSRSSALASKATGYPLAFVAAKLGLGIPLNEISNSVTKVTCACFEPSLDYVVVKIPRWDLKKFSRVNKSLSSAMKSVGEVMSIGRTFEETIQKAIRSIDYHFMGFGENDHVATIDEELVNPSDQRLFAIANAFHKNYSVEQIWKLTNIDKWFLSKLKNIIDLECELRKYNPINITREMLLNAKRLGFSDRQIAKAVGSTELAIRKIRQDFNIIPFVKQIDTVAAEFPAHTNYLYVTYNAVEHDIKFGDKGVMVLGSGVYRIGSSVEFDWCAVRAIRTLRRNGIKTIMVNYNPETVSTDYDEADRLYFDNITLERVLDIYEAEKSSGVIISMGGQAPNNIALLLRHQNVNILGTSPEMIDTAENRYKFSRMLDRIGVDQPVWKELTNYDDAVAFCEKVGYPVLVRPSYVLSGAAMNAVYSSDDLENYLRRAAAVSRDHPVVISKYIEEAKEIEMDAVASDGNLLIHVISEHIENAGVHSGDATLVLPPQDLDPETVSKIKSATEKIANELNVTGPFNIQFIAKNNDIKVIECNLRASRSFPFASKVMGIDLIEMATMAMLGMPAEPKQLNLPKDYVAVKVPQFSFSRLSGADPVLGVEMASTGEVACFGRDKYEAYLKALISTAFTLPKKNILLSIGSYKEKLEMLPSVTKLHSMGFKLFATSGTADFIQEHGIAVKYLDISKGAGHKPEYSLEQHLANNLIDLYINLPSKNRYRRVASFMSNGYRTRRMAVDYSVPLITNVKCAKLFIEALHRNPDLEVQSIDCKCSHETITLPGPFNISAFVPHSAELGKNDFAEVTKASLAAGFTVINTLPIGLNESLRDAGTMAIAHTSSRGNGHCDYALSVAATEYNVEQITEVIPDVASLFIPFSNFVNAQSPKIATIAKHFSSWPVLSPVITDAKGNDLASVLLVASLHSRSIHVTGVSTKDDIEIIRLSKEKGLKVTCDVAVYALFLNTEDIDGCANVLPTPADQSALWKHLDVVDCFSVGTLPYRLSMELGRETCASVGIEETIPLLCNAVNEGKLSMEDIKKRLYTNPRKIFSIPEQINTYVEIEIDRKIKISDKPGRWSPFAGQTLFGAVTRVVLRGETAYLDNGFYSDGNVGCDISSKTYIFTKMSAAEEPVEAEQKPLAIGVNTQPPPKTTVTSAKVIPPSYGSGDIVPKTVAPDWILEPPVMPANLDPFLKNSPFYRKHILSVKEFTRNDLHLLFGVAHEMRTLVERYGSINLLQGRVLFTMFFEPSTRTSASFEAAMNRLGGRVVSVKVDSSSVAKGESLADTVRTLGSYGDLIVLRHPEPGSTKVAAEFSPVPIINAGDGVGEHPTQAFLDVYTIREELGTVNGLTVTLVGDLKNGRTVHSLVKILSLYHVTLNYVSPPSLRMPEDIRVSVDKQGTPQSEFTNLDDVIEQTDVLYVTRIQRERFVDHTEYDRVRDSYVINNKTLAKAKPHMVIMHPLPRINEIDPEVDYDHRAAYFRQMKYGMFVRMSLLALVLGRSS